MKTSTFLTAEWRKLVMANYAVDPDLLKPFVPERTELDLWNDTCYVSLVGFMFLRTKVWGVGIPFHTDFEEVNLRFYVRHHDGQQWKRGVVFHQEIVPRHALTLVANTVYGEHYTTMPMRHSWRQEDGELSVGYSWKKGDRWHSLDVVTGPEAEEMGDDSEAAFITEHYWGYTRMAGGRTSEYGVEHPRWLIYPTLRYQIDVDFGDLYGSAFSGLTGAEPRSVFLAEGSAVEVRKRRWV